MADTYYARFFDTSGAAITGGNGQTWLAIPNPNIDVSSVVSPSYTGASATQAFTVGPDPITKKLLDAVMAKANVKEVEIAHYHDGHLMDAYEFTRVNPTGLSIDFDSGANQLNFIYGGIRAAHYNANGTASSIQTHDLFGHLTPLQGRDGTLPVATVTPATAEPVTSNSPVAAQDTYVRFENPSTGAYLIAADGTTYFHVIAAEPLAFQNNVATSSTIALTTSELNFTIDPASLTAAQHGNFIPAAYSTVTLAAYSIPSDGSVGHFVEGGQFSRASVDSSGSDPSSGQYAFTYGSASMGIAGSSSGPAADGSASGFPGASWANVHNSSSGNPCYCTGTLILTSRGEVPVEALRAGDIVVTASGEHRPVRWIGHRYINIARHPRPKKVTPVRIRAGAIAPTAPLRDLLVSPGHAVAVGSVLVKAERLINGGSIVSEPVSHVTYWHVELDSHDLLVADGLGAESYVDCGNRHSFENGGPVTALHPDFDSLAEHTAQSCLPLVNDGAALVTIREDLIARASAYFSADPAISLVADGVALAPSSVSGRRYEFLVPENTNSLRLVSRSAIAGDVLARSTDRRRLGIAVRGLTVDGAPFATDDLGDGWHEQVPSRDHRWSGGDATLPIGSRIAFTIIALDRYALVGAMHQRRAA